MPLGSLYVLTIPTVFGVGNRPLPGYCHRSDDSGTTWQQFTINGTGTLGSKLGHGSTGKICSSPDGTKVIAGFSEQGTTGTDFRKLYSSLNSGQTWTEVDVSGLLSTIGTGKKILKLSFLEYIDASTVIAVWHLNGGDPGDWVALASTAVLRSTNNGASWSKIYEEPIASITSTKFHSVSFKDNLIGYALCIKAVNENNLRFKRTTDGGVNWSEIADDFVDSVYNRYSVIASSISDRLAALAFNDFGVSGATPRAKFSDNQGTTFGANQSLGFDNTSALNLAVNKSEHSAGKNYVFSSNGTATFRAEMQASGIGAFSQVVDKNSLLGITFSNALNGFMNCSQDGKVRKSSNSGASWVATPFILPSGQGFNSIYTALNPCDLVIDSIDIVDTPFGASTGSATINASGETGLEYQLTGISDPSFIRPYQAGITFTNLPAGTYTATVREAANVSCIQSQQITIASVQALAATASSTNVTANGLSDGTITVNVTAGTGQYEVTFDYPGTPVVVTLTSGFNPQQTVQTGRGPGVYDILVRDLTSLQQVNLQAIITEPTAEVTGGDYLFVPMMNSLMFVEEQVPDGCVIFQQLDNVLFCKQKFPGFYWQNYYQKVAKCDIITIQFLSNYDTNIVELREYVTDTLVRNYLPEVKEQNTNQAQEFGITIVNHGSMQSRVYFNVGGIPVPVGVGDSFQIFNNGDGFNGGYLIVSIQNDPILGQQYIVINKEYTLLVPSSSGEARFIIDNQIFNVLEFLVNDLNTVANGKYYFKVIGTGSATPRTWVSEPINLSVEHEETNLLVYRNFDNAFDMTWTTGITCSVRIESTLFKRLPDGEDESYTNCDLSLVKLSAKRIRRLLFEIWDMPPYMHERLAVIFGMDFFTINGVRYQTKEKYEDPKYRTRYPLSNSQIIIETYGWFDKYNSDDIGPVDGNNTGLIIGNGGFIKL